jgi:HrpA-like RNA helicase
MKHIDTAISNLQNLGALTIPNDKSQTGELTELGKVYSELPIDLKYSRFLVLSFCFDLIEPAIIVCSILTQEKMFFKVRKSALRHLEIKKHYDCGTDNDFIVLYNAYKAWSQQYGNECGQYEYSRRQNKFVTREERTWCHHNDIDDRVIREVRNVIIDLKKRLIKLCLYNDQLKRNYDFSNDKESLFFFNVCII